MQAIIDLRSDTVTRPSPEMRAAMAQAEVGDDVFGEDPTVNQLEALAASLTGKERALFLPTGTMANLVAFLAQTRPGDTVILHEDAHPYRFEAANIARFGGLLTRPLSGKQGKLDVARVAKNILRQDNPHFSPTTIVSIENTTNLGCGAFYTPAEVTAMAELCSERGIRLHCDGARIFNGAVAQNIPVSHLAAPCHSVSFCLSKGLGAPMGSLLASDEATIRAARRIRKQLGGGMRQAGIAAAAGIHALENHTHDLADDHRRAAHFRERLEGRGISFPLPSPTNIVILASEAPEAHVAALKEAGVHVLPLGPGAIRAAFHRDISDEDTERAIIAFESAVAR